MKLYDKWRQWEYYVLIGVISLVALFFLPLIGSEAGLAWSVPNTAAGWLVYIVSKLLVATINILIFHCFIQQAKLNIQDNPKYVEAMEILDKALNTGTEVYRSPQEYLTSTYGRKGVTIFITSLLSAVGLTQAVLTFDWVSMLTYFVTILMGVIFGILQMNQTEIYWTTEYWRYAKKTAETLEVAKRASLEQKDDCTNNSGGTDLLESIDCDRVSSDICEPVVVGSIQ